jgi:hypothetical protein
MCSSKADRRKRMANDRSMTVDYETTAKIQIRELIELFFHAADTHNYSLWTQCFAPNGSMAVRVGTPEERLFEGRDQVVRQLTTIQSHDLCHHVVGNVRIDLTEPSRATSTTFVVAHLQWDSRLFVRGTRLDDRVVLDNDGWVFEHRELRPRWQYEVVAMIPPMIPAEVEGDKQ